MRQQKIGLQAGDSGVVLWRQRQIALSARDVVAGLFFDPGVVKRSVIRHEIEHQREAALPKTPCEGASARHCLPISNARCSR